MAWTAGEVIVVREVLGGRIRSARPLRVIEDGPARTVGMLTPRSQVAWPRLADGAQSQTPDQGWRLRLEQWQGPGALFVLDAGRRAGIVRFLDPGSGATLGWKVDFWAPPQRRPNGFDTLDYALDLMVEPDRRSWRVKDEDDLAALRRVGLLDGAELAALFEERSRVEAELAAGRFGAGWADWAPPPGWGPLRLPLGWHDTGLGDTGLGDAGLGGYEPAAAPEEVLSGAGAWVLDGAGRRRLDLDLAGGTLVLGHADPAVAAAIARQAHVGWAA
ncbi:MAG: DUF402 domain-containing protein, partial [Acidimicrobiales bacterium]